MKKLGFIVRSLWNQSYVFNNIYMSVILRGWPVHSAYILLKSKKIVKKAFCIE